MPRSEKDAAGVVLIFSRFAAQSTGVFVGNSPKGSGMGRNLLLQFLHSPHPCGLCRSLPEGHKPLLATPDENDCAQDQSDIRVGFLLVTFLSRHGCRW